MEGAAQPELLSTTRTKGGAANCVTLGLTVGDPGSHSERWNFEVFEEATGRDVVHHCDDGFGAPSQIRAGQGQGVHLQPAVD